MAQKQSPVNIPFIATGVKKLVGTFKMVRGEVNKMNSAFGRGFTGQLNNQEKQLIRHNKTLAQTAQSWKALGSGMSSAGRKMRSGGFQSTFMVTAPIVMAMKKGVSTAIQYEKGLTTISAKLGKIPAKGKTAAQSMNAFSTSLRGVAVGSIQTTTDLLNASILFAKAGVKEAEILNMIGPVKTVATTEQQSAPRAAKKMLKMSSIFDIPRTVAAFKQMADEISFISTNTTGDLNGMYQGLVKAGGTAKSFGGTLAETLNTLGLMADLGVEGSKAGVGLQNFQTYLLQDTKLSKVLKKKLGISRKDLIGDNGEIKDMYTVMTTIMKSFHKDGATDLTKLTVALELFKRRSLSVIVSMLQTFKTSEGAMKTTANFERYAKRRDVLKAGGHRGMAETQEKLMETTVWAKNQKFTSALQALAITIGDSGVLDTLSGIVVALTEMAIAVSKWDPKTLKTLTYIAVGLAAIGPAAIIAGSALSLGGTLITGLGMLTGALATMGTVGFLPYIATKLGLVTTGLVAFSKGLWLIAKPLLVLGSIYLVTAKLMQDFEFYFKKIQSAVDPKTLFGNFINEWLAGYDRIKKEAFSWDMVKTVGEGLVTTMKEIFLYLNHRMNQMFFGGIFNTENPFKDDENTKADDNAIADAQIAKMKLMHGQSDINLNINNSNGSAVSATTKDFTPNALTTRIVQAPEVY